MWLSLTSGYSVIRCAAIPLLVRSKTPLVFTFFDIFASTFKKNFNGEFNRHGALAMNVDFSRIFFSCVFNTLPIHQLIIIARATRSSRTPKKRRPSCWSEIARGATRRADAWWWWFPFSSCLSPRLFGPLFFVSFLEREEKIGKQKMPTTTRLLRGRLLRGGILAFFFTCALLKIATTLPSETATKGGGIETDD